jgi:tetratricopeptide (TPR) repeat protein
VDLVREERKVEGAGVLGSVSAASFPLILALKQSGDIDAAHKLAADLHEPYDKMTASARSHLSDEALAYLGLIEAADGRQTEADEYLQRVLSMDPKDKDTLLRVAELCALLGKDEIAIATLKRALDAGYRNNVSPVTFPEFQSIRGHPEFRALFKLGE